MSELGFCDRTGAADLLSNSEHARVDRDAHIGEVAEPGDDDRAALRIASNAWPMCSTLSTPTVTIALSAPCPLVTLRANSAASSMLAKVSVAPSSSPSPA
jgi:hypothetical protein